MLELLWDIVLNLLLDSRFCNGFDRLRFVLDDMSQKLQVDSLVDFVELRVYGLLAWRVIHFLNDYLWTARRSQSLVALLLLKQL